MPRGKRATQVRAEERPVKTLEADGTVTPDGRLSVQIPFALSPGKHRVVVVIDEHDIIAPCLTEERFPIIDPGPWPRDLSLGREDLYSDAGG